MKKMHRDWQHSTFVQRSYKRTHQLFKRIMQAMKGEMDSLLSNRVDSNLSFSCLVRYHKQEIAVKPKP